MVKYSKEDSRKLNELGLEFLAIMEQTGKGVGYDHKFNWVGDRNDRQKIIISRVVEKMQPGIGFTASSMLNGKNFGFSPEQRFGLDLNNSNRTQLEHEDLVNAGNVSVIEGFEKYDPSRASVSTFVIYKAKAGMQKCAIDNLPYGHKHHKRNGKEVPNNLSIDELTNISNEGTFPNKELERDFLSHPAEQDEVIALNEWESIMREHLCKLDPREERILRQRFGLRVEEYTLEEIGLELGISRERVRQIEEKGLKKIKRSLQLAGLVASYN
tara:strand:- start:138 stop:947 length:810 start_codon:yes stop_codon:yes gene_type:complete